MGLVQPYKTADTAKGRVEVPGKDADRLSFKVPTLRNGERTYPYCHNGEAAALTDAEDLMVRLQLGREFSQDENAKIVAFLKTLTGQQPQIALPILPPSTDKTPKPRPCETNRPVMAGIFLRVSLQVACRPSPHVAAFARKDTRRDRGNGGTRVRAAPACSSKGPFRPSQGAASRSAAVKPRRKTPSSLRTPTARRHHSRCTEWLRQVHTGHRPDSGRGSALMRRCRVRLALRAVRAVPRTRPYLRMLATSVGSLLVHRAPARFCFEEMAIPAGSPCQREDAVLEVEVVDQPGLLQPFRDLLGRIVLRLERIHQAQPHQFGQPQLHRHGAAVGHTVVAHPGTETRPGFRPVNFDDVDR